MSNLRYVKSTKYPNKCAECKEIIPKGAPAWWNGEQDKTKSRNYHENHKPNADSGEVAGSGETGVVSPNRVLERTLSPTDNGEAVRKRLVGAKAMVLKEFPNIQQFPEAYYQMCQEYFHQLQSEIWLSK